MNYHLFSKLSFLMDINDESVALTRIVTSIREYRHQTGDYHDLFNNELVDQYLKDHLTVADYLVWQHLQVDNRISADSLAFDFNESLSLNQFKLLLRNYKRGVYENFHHFWN